jgi:hypothetical protein
MAAKRKRAESSHSKALSKQPLGHEEAISTAVPDPVPAKDAEELELEAELFGTGLNGNTKDDPESSGEDSEGDRDGMGALLDDQVRSHPLMIFSLLPKSCSHI